MDLKIAWWNCHLSAPASKAKPGVVTAEFITVILSMLDSGVDLLCLCEVNEDNCLELERRILAATLIDPKYALYTVRSLYSKDGNKIDDYGIVYNHEKLSPTSEVVDLNAKSDVSAKHLKVGRRLRLKLHNAVDLWLILCHWQSLRTYSEDSHIRTEIASELRGYVKDIYDDDPNALIVICGDFNDEPFSRSIQMALKASRDISYVRARSDALFNPFWRLIGMTDLVTGTHLPAGTCVSTDSQQMTNWRTFDQIILSSGFLKDGWSFVGSGVEIMTTLNISDSTLKWCDFSDHYPITCNLKRVV
ncbi:MULTISPECIES: endonuclease/exonuclease/phosphatase family protein [Pseudomonas]|uniref:endonuclease/exonuclease/phosphatase family protein n=1 Tax=Pseudomonas TaxID=286 RepID=UPI00117A0EAF|nr:MULTISPECIES: endonuclease/exonuclease/phosphatase family protein [Pseudomonas]